MAPAIPLLSGVRKRAEVDPSTVEVSWVNQATWRHCHFGPKSAPQHRDFGPGKVGVTY